MKKILSIEKYKGRTMMVEIENGEPVFINADIVSAYSLKAGISVPDSAFADIIHADTYRKARERAMYLLDYRDHSYAELVKKLMKNYDEDICLDVADELAEKGFINDARYAAVLARRQCEVKLLGAYRARTYMRERGIPAALVEQALAEYEDSAAERAAELVRKKYMKYYDPEDRKQTERLKNALVRSGYSFSQVKAALELLEEEEDDD